MQRLCHWLKPACLGVLAIMLGCLLGYLARKYEGTDLAQTALGLLVGGFLGFLPVWMGLAAEADKNGSNR